MPGSGRTGSHATGQCRHLRKVDVEEGARYETRHVGRGRNGSRAMEQVFANVHVRRGEEWTSDEGRVASNPTGTRRGIAVHPPQEMGETNAGVAVDVPAPFARTTKDRNWQRMTEVDVCGFVRRRVSLEGCTAAERTCNLATRRDAYLPSERFSNDRFPRNRTCSSNGANHDVLHRAVAVSCRKTAPFAVV